MISLGNKLVQPLWTSMWSFLKKLKIELPSDPAVPLLGIYLKETKSLTQKRYLRFCVHCNIICNSQDMKATLVSIHG